MAEYKRFSMRLYHRVTIRRVLTEHEQKAVWAWVTSDEAAGKFSGQFGDDIDPLPHFRFTNRNTALEFKLRFG